jgi:hypothetical protein
MPLIRMADMFTVEAEAILADLLTPEQSLYLQVWISDQSECCQEDREDSEEEHEHSEECHLHLVEYLNVLMFLEGIPADPANYRIKANWAMPLCWLLDNPEAYRAAIRTTWEGLMQSLLTTQEMADLDATLDKILSGD